MSLAYQSFSDPRAASRFLAEREEARLLGGGTLLVRHVNGDFSVALLALGAIVSMEGPEGAGELDLEGFFKSRARLAFGTIVTTVLPGPRTRCYGFQQVPDAGSR
jgi:CO/xanthine dehydrogenase FAD-binding subunit